MTRSFGDRYRIIRQLAAGESSAVYLAEVLAHPGRHVAVKLFVDLPAGDSEVGDRLRRLARAAAVLAHQNVARIIDVGESENKLCVVMEHVEGVTLAQRLKDSTVHRALAWQWMQQLASALDYVHQHGVVHASVDLGHVMIDENGSVKLVGFVRSSALHLDTTLTRSGASRPLDFNHLSPEQVRGQVATSASDVFAFGTICYELVTGREAFPHDLPAVQLAARIVDAEVDSVGIAIVDRCLTKATDQRPTMRDVAAALASSAGAAPTSEGSATQPGRGRRPPEDDVARRRAEIDRYLAAAGRQLDAAHLEDAIELLNQAAAIDPRHAEADALRERVRAALRARQTPRRIDENVQFSVYRPPAVAPARWYTMLVFAHLASRRPDAPPDEPDPLDEVRRRAKAALGSQVSEPTSRVDSGVAIPEEDELRIVPHVPGITFNPPEHIFRWLESVHQVEFRLLAEPEMEGRTARGAVTVCLGLIAVAQIPLAIPVEAQVDERERPATHVVNPYRRLFASYSHLDEAVVRQFENYAKGLGDRYVRDVIDLRTGEVWNPRLCELIESADVFQLFWSRNAMESAFVRQEWEHALTVAKPDFIRPLYWEVPFPAGDNLPPASLARLHFAFVGSPAAVALAAPPTSSVPSNEIREREEQARREAESREQEHAELRAHEEAHMRELQRAEEERCAREEQARRDAEARERDETERRAREEAHMRELQRAEEECAREEQARWEAEAREREQAERRAREEAHMRELQRAEEERRAREEQARRETEVRDREQAERHREAARMLELRRAEEERVRGEAEKRAQELSRREAPASARRLEAELPTVDPIPPPFRTQPAPVPAARAPAAGARALWILIAVAAAVMFAGALLRWC